MKAANIIGPVVASTIMSLGGTIIATALAVYFKLPVVVISPQAQPQQQILGQSATGGDPRCAFKPEPDLCEGNRRGYYYDANDVKGCDEFEWGSSGPNCENAVVPFANYFECLQTCVKGAPAIDLSYEAYVSYCNDNLIPREVKKIQYDADLDSEILVSCGYLQPVAGAGGDFLLVAIDVDGNVLWQESLVGEGEAYISPEVIDIDRDGIHEIVWSTTGCVTGSGCVTTTVVYSSRYKESLSVSSEAEMDDDGGWIEKAPVYSENLRQKKYSVFRDYLERGIRDGQLKHE